VTQPNCKRSTRYDQHVGAHLRLARRSRGVSQDALGKKLGLTFQQIQKYERGANRISAGRLFEVSIILEMEITYFFEGLHMAPTSDPLLIQDDEASTLFAKVSSIRNSRVRRQVLDLISALASDGRKGAKFSPNRSKIPKRPCRHAWRSFTWSCITLKRVNITL